MVAEPMRRLGLGRLLLETLIGAARRHGAAALHAYIATADAPVRRLLTSLGFAPSPPTGSGDVQFILTLSGRI